ncbi:hypothetical protein FACS189468_8300 [Spirochaetia bacterium]|nr:hypothetical protein FACS189468_8300 [Spirochaetia bacterium]
MLYRTVSRMPELNFSVLGFGCWSLGEHSGWTNANDEASIRTIETAIDYGVTFFDTAPVYGFGTSEPLLGKAIKGKRDKLIIASKCGLQWNDKHETRNDLSEASVLKEIDQTLKRLNVDYVDIYHLHWPDPKVRVEDLRRTLDKLLDSTKVRYIGLSNFSLGETKKLCENVKVAAYQGLYNTLEQNEETYHAIPLNYKMKDEMLPFCGKNGLALFPYSPLMQGVLTDTFDIARVSKDDIRRQNPKFAGDQIGIYTEKAGQLKEYAQGLGLTLIELTYGF